MRRLRAFFVAVVTWLGIHPAQGGIPVVLDNGELPSLAPLVEQAKPAVVTVFAIRPRSAQSTPPGGSPGEASTPGIGSGVIVDAKKGIVLTSFSNVAGASELTVLLLDGRLLDAKVVGGDPVTDLAVLHVEAENLKALRMADSDGLRVGDFVLAIGNPFGVGKSVSSGIVSGLGRASSQAATFTDHIQTDAPINPGSSGGALINLRGELVGIATGLLGPVPVNVGIGFAVPSNTAFLVLVQILEHGEVRRGFLGVTAQDLNPDVAQGLSISIGHGALIVDVRAGTPAEAAGLRRGDVVIAVDGSPVRGSGQMRSLVGLVRLGGKVTLSVLREGAIQSMEVKLTQPTTAAPPPRTDVRGIDS
jgi:S1-C subfamily serine protease